MRPQLAIVFFCLFLGVACGGSGSSSTSDNSVPETPGTSTPPAPGPDLASSSVLISLDTEELSDEEEEDEADEVGRDFAALDIRRIGQSSFFELRLPKGADLDAILEELDADARVVRAEINYDASAPEGGPDDVPTLGSELLSSIRNQPALQALGIAEANAISTGIGVVVAVVDTGVDPTHPYLLGRVTANGFDFIDRDDDASDERDFVDNDGDGAVDEQYGHGTFIASLVLAVAPDAVILPVRVLDSDGYGNASTMAAGIMWAADAGADIINVSVEMAFDSEAVKDAIDYANDRGVVVVAAAGNQARTEVSFPAQYGDVIAVAALDTTNAAAPFSNTGGDIDVAAPGVSLLGAVPLDLNPAGTARWSGTSFAAPLFSGSAALIRAQFPELRGSEAAERLLSNARFLGDELGEGIVRPLETLLGR